MKKAFDQTVREIKREVNKKVLKVPRAEQKVLDATSNEPWGPHGSLLADIAQATRNYHEYQMIMTVIWKRVSDTGKNWRHVYKALTVLEYLVGHGSERVIDEIREHAYQISTLSDFQYIDSYGRDQGSNVRKKSQSLVVLVNDKERIQEVRQKAAANRDKFRNASMGGMYGTGSGNYGYDDDCFGSRDDHRNGYGYDDRYGWDGDRYNGDPDDRYGRDGYRDDGYRGRSRSIDERYSSRSRSLDRDRDRAFEDDDQNSTRASGAKANDRSQDGSVSGQQLERKFSEQNLNAPPSYEEAVGETRSPVRSERDGETSVAPATKAPAPITSSPSQTDTTTSVPAPQASAFTPPNASVSSSASFSPPGSIPANKEFDSYDEFDPRGPSVAASTSFNDAGMDLLGSLSDSFSSNPLAIVAVSPTATAPETNASAKCSSGSTFAATASASNGDQPFDDPFGDGPFRALPGTDAAPAQSQNIASTPSLVASTNQSSEVPQSINPYGQVPPTMISSFAPQGLPKSDQDTTDILADILPSSGPSPPVASQTGFPHQPAAINGYPTQAGPHEHQKCFPSQVGQPPSQTSFVARNDFPGEGGAMPGFVGQMNSAPQIGFAGQINSAPQSGFAAPSPQPAQPTASSYGNYLQQQAPAAPAHMVSHPAPPVGAITQNNNLNSHSQSSHGNVLSSTLMASQQTLPASTALAIVPQPTEDKFETKSTVWADTLSRGLVNLNISGPKTNPLADIGVDFDAINRREKRMEKPTPTTSNVTSTITMGKAMGTGSGIGRAGAGVLRSPANPMAGAGMGMGVAGGYGGGMNQYPMGLNIGMGMNVGPSLGMGMNMGMSQGGAPMQPMGFPPGAGANVAGGYNPMMGRGGGYAQPPYGGGYR